MSDALKTKDLNRLAVMSSEVVHCVDFPELGNSADAVARLLGEIDRLDHVYANNALMFDLRATICSRPLQKQALYEMTHSIVREARGASASDAHHFPMQSSAQIGGVMGNQMATSLPLQ